MSLFSHPNSSTGWHAGNPAESPGTSAPRKKKNAGRQRADSPPPRRTLPSYRARPAQQINILLALADLGTGSTPVQRAALAEHVGMGAATVGDCMAFLADVHLVEAGRGQYAVTAQGRAFAEAWRRDSAQARLLLHPLLRAHWSAAVTDRYLADGPVPQEELGKRLRRGLPGVAARGQYMVEWLVIALVVERDERLHVRLPDTGPATARSREPGPAGQEQAAPGEGSTHSGDTAHAEFTAVLLGMTRQEIQALPDTRYVAFLEGVLNILRSALAHTG
ncbi:hypothetical protein [Streptomyces sp. NPDC051554]|uniref:hypothetical protein n=1 Tax=Streptomyces sp. NPDC051554 TaxID=3365656 RepID=UPI0037B6180B